MFAVLLPSFSLLKMHLLLQRSPIPSNAEQGSADSGLLFASVGDGVDPKMFRAPGSGVTFGAGSLPHTHAGGSTPFLPSVSEQQAELRSVLFSLLH